MSKITPVDLEIILKGAVHMAQQDSKVVDQEKGFIKKLINVGEIDDSEVEDLTAPIEESILELSEMLSCNKAKKVFLLTLFAIANADGEFCDSEQSFLEDLSKKLGVGRIKVNKDTVKACEKEVFRLIAED